MQGSLVHAPFATVPFVNTTTYYPRQHRDMYPSVLVGDFNCEADATEIRFLKGLQSIDGRSAYFADAWERAGDGSDGFIKYRLRS